MRNLVDIGFNCYYLKVNVHWQTCPSGFRKTYKCFHLFHIFFFQVPDYRESTLIENENTGAVKVPFFDFGEIVDTKLRSQAEIKISYEDYI